MIKIDQEFKALIPALSKEEYEQLEKNCIEEGIRESIIVWEEYIVNSSCPECDNELVIRHEIDNDYHTYVCADSKCMTKYFSERNFTIIDGHNRYEIAQKHKLIYQTVTKEFDNRDEVKLWMIDNQLGRRNLPPFVRTELQLLKKGILAEQGKLNISISAKENKGNQYTGKVEALTTLSNTPIIPVNTRKEIATQAKVSEGTVHKVEKILAKAPEEIKEKCRTGEITTNQAYQQVRRIEKIEAIEEKIITKETETKAIDIYNTENKYNIIYADPAWKYFESGNKNQSVHYKTMTIDDICNLPIKDITDENCILFLWVTFPILQECFKVIESWGFKYSTCGFNWIKKNKVADTNFFGCGAWTRANSELCLIATKGSVLRIDNTISQVLETPIEGHSKKPEIVRELITRLVGELPRIELFSRDSIDGWDCWGNEI